MLGALTKTGKLRLIVSLDHAKSGILFSDLLLD
jgi:Origin recognition complex subunit 2